MNVADALRHGTKYTRPRQAVAMTCAPPPRQRQSPQTRSRPVSKIDNQRCPDRRNAAAALSADVRLFWRLRDPSSALRQIIPRRVDSQPRVPHYFIGQRHQVADRALELPLRGCIRRAHVEIVRCELLLEIRGKNFGPCCVPDSLCEIVVLMAISSLDLSGHHGLHPQLAAV